jgi:MEDS: MEthanogen/methylotroph, DcmR Sensory domain
MSIETAYGDWLSANVDTFWGEIARFDHVVQVYENDGIFLDTLTGFVESAISFNENAVVIASNAHLSALEFRLQSYGHHIETLILENKFIPISAEDLLTEFLVNDLPDEAKFTKAATKLFDQASVNQRKFRAFGEMVAILWAKGNKKATLQLEHLWSNLLSKDPFCLFCAYPKNIFNDRSNNSAKPVCNAHTKIISGEEKQLTHVLYRNTS